MAICCRNDENRKPSSTGRAESRFRRQAHLSYGFLPRRLQHFPYISAKRFILPTTVGPGRGSDFAVPRPGTRHLHMTEQCFRRISWGTLLFALWGTWSCASSPQKIVPPPTPTVTLSASTTSITSGQSVTLSWQTTNATSVTISANNGSSTRTVTTSTQASGSVQDSPTQTTTYTAVATGTGGNSSPQTAQVQVAQPVPPQITAFSASPTSVNAGQTVTLSWATSNATSVSVSPSISSSDESGTLPTSGSVTTPISTTTTFSLTATGPGGNAGPQTVSVSVPFTLSLTASPTTLTSGQTATLTWQITGELRRHSLSLTALVMPSAIRVRHRRAQPQLLPPPRPLIRQVPPRPMAVSSPSLQPSPSPLPIPA